MPFTPLQMGPAILLKALRPRSFSLMVFGWTQILMDLQPLFVMLSGRGELHGASHTWFGALLLGLLAAPSGKYLGTFGLVLLGLRGQLPITWRVAWISACIGSASHLLLDSIVHADMQPLAPFATGNVLLGLISWEAMTWLCLTCAVLGGPPLLYRLRRRTTPS